MRVESARPNKDEKNYPRPDKIVCGEMNSQEGAEENVKEEGGEQECENNLTDGR